MVRHEEIRENLKNIARKYSRGLRTMTVEDLEQELWLDFCTKEYDSVAVATTSLVHKALDIYRRETKRDYPINVVDFSNPITDNAIDHNESSDNEMSYGFVENDTLERMSRNYLYEEILAALNKERDAKYFICKAYLDCKIDYFKEMCLDIVQNEIENEEDRKNFLSNPKRGTDDMILKNILHIKTGTNSGTIRAMKNCTMNDAKQAIVNYMNM